MGGASTPARTEKPSPLPVVQSPASPPGQNPCGDGVCGPAEMADPNLCPADCPGTALPTPEIDATVVAPTPTQLVEALPNELTFIPDPGIRIKMASQPAPIVAADGSIYVFYASHNALPNEPNSDAVAHSEDGLNFTEVGLEPHSVSIINPFATQLPDGTWRLYDFDMNTGVMTSRSSTDGIHFTPDDGIRYTAPPDHLPIGVRDFFVNTSGDVILLYIGAMGKENHYIRNAVSSDGGEHFTLYADDALGDQNNPGLERDVDPKFVTLPDGRARLITMVQYQVPIPGQRSCCKIYSFTSADGYTYTQDAGVRLQSSDFTEFTVWSLNDPWVILLPDGRYRLYVAALLQDDSMSEPFWAILSATTP